MYLMIDPACQLRTFMDALYVGRACDEAHRAVIAATRNTHFYEMALIGPDMPNIVPPVYACGYSDQPEDLGEDGCVPVPDGPGLGVRYDWEFIERHRTALFAFGREV